MDFGEGNNVGSEGGNTGVLDLTVATMQPRQKSVHRPLFELMDVGSKFVMENVYLNGLHALRRFEIRNICDSPVLIKLRSNLGHQIAFQLTNENLTDSSRFSKTGNQRLSQSMASSVQSASLRSFGARNNSSLSVNSSISTLESPPLSPRFSVATDDSIASTSNFTTPSEPGSPLDSTTGHQGAILSAPANDITPFTTNTAEAAALGVFGNGNSSAMNGHQFNQLFNYVNHIDEVEIPARSSQKVIVAFLPDAPGKRNKNSDDAYDRNGDREYLGQGDGDETFDFFETNGLLFFLGYRIERVNGGDVEVHRKLDVSERLSVSGIFDSAAGQGDNPGAPSNENSSESSRLERTSANDVREGGQSVSPDSQITVKFRSRVCKSVFWTDIGETGVIFDDCVVGGTYFKDFTIWNRSEIDLYWVLNTMDLSNQDGTWLRFSEYETGDPINGKPIAPFSPRRIRVAFKPTDTGEFNYELQLENANDASNIVQALIHAVVRSAHKEESLVIGSGNLIDFGDCIAGTWNKQRMVLRNVSEAPLDISFSADTSNVVFQLKADELGGTTGEAFESASSLGPGGRRSSRQRERLIRDHLRSESSHSSDPSASPSNFSSRASSPTSLNRADSDIFSGFGSVDLMDLIQGVSKSSGLPPSKDRVLPGGESDGEDENEGARRVWGSSTRSLHLRKFTRIEELTLRPGTERTVEVCYRPERDLPTPDYRHGRLVKRSFKILVSYSQGGVTRRDKKTVQCKARTCTSFIEVAPKELDFGDTDVNTLKSAPVVIRNMSEMTGKVEFRFISKVLNTYRDEISIPAKQSVEVKIDIYPRKVNPGYRKQVTVANLLNRDNDQNIEVRSTNIDKNRVTFHSLFYRIHTPTSTNFLDFGSVILNAPSLRTFTIENISAKKLVLALSSSHLEEIKLYVRAQNHGQVGSANFKQQRETLLESIGSRRAVPRSSNLSGPGVATSAELDPSNLTIKLPNQLTVAKNDNSSANTDEDRQQSSGVSNMPEYLDLASPLPGENAGGRRSPKRKQVAQTPSAQIHSLSLRQLRLQYRERKGISDYGQLTTDPNPPSEANTPSQMSMVKEAATPVGDDDFGRIVPAEGGTKVRKSDPSLNGEIEKSPRFSMNNIIAAFESTAATVLPNFSRSSSEENYVQAQILMRRELQNLISGGQLTEVSSVEVMPDSEISIVAIFTASGQNRPHIQTKPRKHDARIYFRLLEFDRELQQPQFDQLLSAHPDDIPVRELMMRSSLCRSVLDLGQKNINFGVVEKGEQRAKSIVIRNNSEMAAMYAIRKSGSIASGDILFRERKLGLIRGYGKREIEFVFEPTMPGNFHERVTIENVFDRANDQVLSVKANVRKAEPFIVENSSLEFRSCVLNEWSKPQTIVVGNTSSKQSRTMEVRVDPSELELDDLKVDVVFQLVDEDLDVAGSISAEDALSSRKMTKEVLEQIDNYEQKLKIARRKGRDDKVKTIQAKLQELRSGTAVDRFVNDNDISATGEGNDGEEAAEKVETDSSVVVTKPSSFGGSQINLGEPTTQAPTIVRRTGNSIIFSIEPNGSKKVSIAIRPAETSSQSQHDEILDDFDPGDVTPRPNMSFSLEALEPASECPPLELVPPSIETGRTRRFSANVYVQQHKNTDLVKMVTFEASILSGQWISSDVLEIVTSGPSRPDVPNLLPNTVLEELRSGEQRSSSSTRGLERQGSTSGVRSRSASEMSGIRESSAGTTSVLTSTPLSPISVKLGVIDLGRVEVHEKRECYFTLVNQSTMTVTYEIVGDMLSQEDNLPTPTTSLTFPSRIGSLDSGQVQTVDLAIFPSVLGRSAYSFVVRDLNSGHEIKVVFKLYGIASSYIRFPELEGERATSGVKSTDVNLGYCYVDPSKKFAHVMPILVENIFSEDLVFSAQSNLAQQCLVFADDSLERPSLELQLPKATSRLVYMALQPYVTSGGSKRTIVSDSSLGLVPSRTLVGGVKFSVYAVESSAQIDQISKPSETELTSTSSALFHLTTQTLKFTAVIGQSVGAVSTSLIDLGVSDSVGIYSSGFKVFNLSTGLPLKFQLKSLQGKVQFDQDIYVIAGSDPGSNSGTAGPLDYSSTWIDVKLKCSEPGLISDVIELRNLNNSSQIFMVEVRMFIDIGFLQLRGQDIGEGTSTDVDIKQPPSLAWNGVYVTTSTMSAGNDQEASVQSSLIAQIQKKARSEVIPMYEKTVEVENTSQDSVDICTLSNFDVDVYWKVSTGSGQTIEVDISDQLTKHFEGKSTDSLREHVQRGPVLHLLPNQRAAATISVPKPTSLAAEDVQLVASGDPVSSHGTLLFARLTDGLVLKLLDLKVGYCVSRGEVEPSSINLGKIGFSNSWEAVPFSFDVCNRAEIPLQYDVVLPSAIEMTTIGGIAVERISASKRKIEGVGSHTVQALLRPRQIPDISAGQRIFDISLINVYNPKNTIHVVVSCYVTTFALRFDRLDRGELLLPPMHYPQVPNNPSCDSWFTIFNSSDEDAKFEIDMKLSPDVSEFTRGEILSRFTNSPLVGTISLPPQGYIEVRVRIHQKADRRLTFSGPKASYLLNPEGITFGSLIVTPKVVDNPSGETTSPRGVDGLPVKQRLGEEIAIRGRVIESQTFSVSEKRIEFRSSAESDNEDDEISDSGTSKSASRARQTETLMLKNWTIYPLQIQMTIENPIELGASASVLTISPPSEDSTWTIDPEGTLLLTVELADRSIEGLSEELRINFVDKCSIKKNVQTVLVGIVESITRTYDAEHANRLDSSTPHASDNSNPPLDSVIASSTAIVASPEDGSSQNDDEEWYSDVASSLDSHERPTPRASTQDAHGRRHQLILRGCNRVKRAQAEGDDNGLYELNLGQLDLGSNPVTKKLVVENPSVDKVSYCLKPLRESDKKWILFGRLDGTLGGVRQRSTNTEVQRESHTISLTFLTGNRGQYATYLALTNVENPGDTKIIRIAMEVVAKQNVRRTAAAQTVRSEPTSTDVNLGSNRVFDVYSNVFRQLTEDMVIPMDHLYYDNEVSARSLLIFNRESVPLEFTLKSNLSSDDPMELIFSLSRSTVKLFQSLTIQPESFARVYLRVCPATDTPPPVTLKEAECADEKHIEIYINCRLVKDYQKTVRVIAIMRHPQIRVSAKELSFSGSIRRRQASRAPDEATSSATPVSEKPVWNISLSEMDRRFSLSNVFDDELVYSVLNDTMYFNLELCSGEESTTVDQNTNQTSRMVHGTIGPLQSVQMFIRPRIDVMLQNVDAIRKERYIVEHMTVYNRRRPTERYWITVKLSFGHLLQFQSASGTKHSLEVLEHQIVDLLKDFYSSRAADLGSDSKDVMDLYFRYIYIIDQIVHFGTREHASENYHHLANLLFTTLFAHPSFQDKPSSPSTSSRRWHPSISRWRNEFLQFMSYFPIRYGIESMRDLAKMLVDDAR
ncbi:hypothetical protein BJ742DRAFT_709657 [Cladochytrium replicatum]|nr:hypothetical protein BJ742DRAFT_709657 [Cladochytrium replicatum]